MCLCMCPCAHATLMRHRYPVKLLRPGVRSGQIRGSDTRRGMLRWTLSHRKQFGRIRVYVKINLYYSNFRYHQKHNSDDNVGIRLQTVVSLPNKIPLTTLLRSPMALPFHISNRLQIRGLPISSYFQYVFRKWNDIYTPISLTSQVFTLNSILSMYSYII